MERRSWAIVLVAAFCVACATPAPSIDAPATAAETSSAPAIGESATPAPQTAWQPLPDAPFSRLEMATAAHGDRIWIAGGLDPLGAALDDVAIFDPADASWTDGPALPEPVHHAALVSDGERLMVIGGDAGSSFSAPSDRTWVLEEGADEWVEGPRLPAPRMAGAAAWDGARVVYGGGVGAAGVTTDVFIFEDGAWSELGDFPRPRDHLAAASDGAGAAWFLGGRAGSLESNLGDVAVVTGGEVRALDATLTHRGGVAAFWADGLGACLTGGEAPEKALTTVECVDADGAITALPDMTQPRHGHGAAVVGASVYALLGGPQPFLTASSTVEALDLP
jgi:hypothetical protein